MREMPYIDIVKKKKKNLSTVSVSSSKSTFDDNLPLENDLFEAHESVRPLALDTPV